MDKGYSGWELQEQPNWMNNKKELKTFQRQKIYSSTYKAKEKHSILNWFWQRNKPNTWIEKINEGTIQWHISE